MEIIINILISLLITLLIFLMIVVLILILPIFYKCDLKLCDDENEIHAKFKVLFGIVTIEVINKNIEICFCKIKIVYLDNSKRKENSEVAIEKEKKKISLFRKIKIGLYKVETKIKKTLFDIKKTLKNVTEYKYKVELIQKVLEYISKVLKIVKPKEYKTNIVFGTGNAALTGRLIGILAICGSKFKNTTITSNFEKKCLKIEINAKGKITLIRLIVLGTKFISEKSIKELKFDNKKGGHDGKK